MTAFLIRWCVCHFRQAADTRLATRNWKNILYLREAGNILDEITNGKFQLPNRYPEKMAQLLRAAERPHGVKPVLFMMSLGHCTEFCKKQEKRKESSPSGLHYSHTKRSLFKERLSRIKYKIIEMYSLADPLMPKLLSKRLGRFGRPHVCYWQLIFLLSSYLL